jgi:AcrR family transcriptional regulator
MAEQEMSRKTRDKQRREEDFLDAAELLFSRYGYTDTSMEDVAKQAEYATGTIYRYFESKEALYRRIIRRKGESYFAQVAVALSKKTQPLEQLRALLRNKIRFFYANRNFMRIYIQEVSHAGAQQRCQVPEELKGLYAEHQRTMLGVFSAGIKQGVFRRLDPELLLQAYQGLLNELLNPAAQDTADRTEDEIEDFMWGFLQGGLITEQD